MRSEQRGYTMIEVIALIAIVGLVTGGAVKALNKAFSRYKLTRANQQLVELQRNIDRRFVARPSYEGLSLELLHSENLLPKDMRYAGNKLYHRLSGEVKLNVGRNANGDDSSTYKISFSKLPKYACVELVMQNWGLNPTVSLDNISVGSNTLKWRCTSSDQRCYAMPITPVVANHICSNSNNTIFWQFN